MTSLAATLTILAGFFAAFGGWSIWIKAYLDTRFDSITAESGVRFDGIGQRFDGLDQRLDGIDSRLMRIEDVVLREHGERITRLEERVAR